MVSCSQVFSSFPSHPGAPFYCRVIDRERGFEIELFDRATEKAWACSVTPDTLDLHADATTKIPLDKVKSFVKIGLIALGAGQESQDAVLDMIEQPEELIIMQLRLRFGLEGCYWNRTLNFMLDKATAQQREKLELQASIATMASELSNKATTVATSVEQNHPSPLHKGVSLLCSVMVIATAIFFAIVSDITSVADTAPPASRGIAFACFKAFTIGNRNNVIYWEPSSNFDENFFSVKHSRVKVTEAGFAQLSIVLRHSQMWHSPQVSCRSHLSIEAEVVT